MWGYLVLIAGGFFYTIGAIVNAHATPDVSAVALELRTEGMFLLHNIAKLEVQKGNPVTAYGFNSIPSSYGFRDSNWQSTRVNGCIITHKFPNAPISEPRHVTSLLGKYVNDNRSAGYIDTSRRPIGRSIKGPELPASAIPVAAANSPYLYECQL